MPTVVLNAYSKAYPSITNRLRASVFLQSDPQALIATIVEDAPHLTRVWSFPGLPRNNYGFSLDEIDGADAVVNNKALFDVVPGEVDGSLNRDDEQIQVDTTPGFTSGEQVAVFDGTGGAPDYVGWEIVPSELTGRGILALGLDYSWDSETGTFTLLQADDTFDADTIWNIHFNPVSNPQGNSYPSVRDFTTRVLVSDTTLVLGDFGNKILCEPSGTYMEVTLPPIATVAPGRPLLVDIGGDHMSVVKFVPNGADDINFLRGNIYALPSESFTLYKLTRSLGVYEWRVADASGNFRTVGQVVSEDAIQSDVFNKQLLDGTIGSIDEHARLYNEYILNLPLTQVVAYADWSTGNNKYFYSFEDGSGNFRFPDRRGLFDRATTALNKAGDFEDSQNKIHGHTIKSTNSDASNSLSTDVVRGSLTGTVSTRGGADDTGVGDKTIGSSGGNESRPVNYSINKYVLL